MGWGEGACEKQLGEGGYGDGLDGGRGVGFESLCEGAEEWFLERRGGYGGAVGDGGDGEEERVVCGEYVGEDAQGGFLEGFVAFAVAVDEEGHVFLRKGLYSLVGLYISYSGVESYLVQQTTQSQTLQPSLPNRRLMTPHRRNNQVVQHRHKVDIIL